MANLADEDAGDKPEKGAFASFFDLSMADVTTDDLELAYPIQCELRDLEVRYGDLEPLSRGGVKEIFSVTDRQAAQTVAMAKLIKEASRESTEAFFREARVTAALRHPNVVSVYDMGFDAGGTPFFTMELLSGDHLGEVIRDGGLSRAELLDVFARVCDAVGYAHSRGIIHLDLKPENVQVDDFGRVHVCDWGLAKVLTEDDAFEHAAEDVIDPNVLNHATITGRIKGTPGYMAPEQATGTGGKDVRSDVYALGAILYCIVTGESPIAGDSVDERLERTRRGEIRPIAESSNVGSGVQAIINKCLSLDPDSRYGSVAALREDLEKYRRGYATVAEDADFATQVFLLVRRHKARIAAVAGIFIVLAIVTAVAFVRVRNEQQRATKSENVALAQKEEAVRQKLAAETALTALKNEKDLTAALRLDAAVSVTQIVSSRDYKNPIKKIEQIRKYLPEVRDREMRLKVMDRLAELYVVKGDLPRAVEALTADGGRRVDAYLLRECRRFQPRTGPWSDADMARFIGTFRQTQFLPLMRACYAYHAAQWRGAALEPANASAVEDRLALMHTMLTLLNADYLGPTVPGPTYENGRLAFPAVPYRRFRLQPEGRSVLAGLKFDTLDLSQVGVVRCRELHGVKFNRLVVGKSQLPNVHVSIRSMVYHNINRIELHRDAHSTDTLELLEKHFTIIEGP